MTSFGPKISWSVTYVSISSLQTVITTEPSCECCENRKHGDLVIIAEVLYELNREYPLPPVLLPGEPPFDVCAPSTTTSSTESPSTTKALATTTIPPSTTTPSCCCENRVHGHLVVIGQVIYVLNREPPLPPLLLPGEPPFDVCTPPIESTTTTTALATTTMPPSTTTPCNTVYGHLVVIGQVIYVLNREDPLPPLQLAGDPPFEQCTEPPTPHSTHPYPTASTPTIPSTPAPCDNDGHIVYIAQVIEYDPKEQNGISTSEDGYVVTIAEVIYDDCYPHPTVEPDPQPTSPLPPIEPCCCEEADGRLVYTVRMIHNDSIDEIIQSEEGHIVMIAQVFYVLHREEPLSPLTLQGDGCLDDEKGDDDNEITTTQSPDLCSFDKRVGRLVLIAQIVYNEYCPVSQANPWQPSPNDSAENTLRAPEARSH